MYAILQILSILLRLVGATSPAGPRRRVTPARGLMDYPARSPPPRPWPPPLMLTRRSQRKPKTPMSTPPALTRHTDLPRSSAAPTRASDIEQPQTPRVPPRPLQCRGIQPPGSSGSGCLARGQHPKKSSGAWLSLS